MLLYLCQCRPTPASTLPTLSFPLIEPFPLSNPCLKPILKEISMKQKKFRVETDLTCIDHVACVFVPSSSHSSVVQPLPRSSCYSAASATRPPY
ncbi:hypothetical protein L208DRAFT_1407202, partial [Tricholoma matsutake]